jgi:hypothetical protein
LSAFLCDKAALSVQFAKVTCISPNCRDGEGVLTETPPLRPAFLQRTADPLTRRLDVGID